MWEGESLKYYTPSPPLLIPPSSFSYFDRFHSYSTYAMTEDMMVPFSPNSFQSDSDTSVSSVDTHPTVFHSKQVEIHKKTEDVQCRWVSCGIPFESLDELATHVSRVHAASGVGGLFYCGWEGCLRNNKGFNARYKMLVHVRTHTNEKPHQCCQCDKSFSRAENLKIHSRSHSGEKPYVCPVPGCQKAYSNSSDRFKHTRTHQVDKPYQCKVPGCPKRYTDPSSLRKHVKTYKHFVNNDSPDVNGQSITNIIVESHQNVESSMVTCNCTHNCSSNKHELLGSFINFNNITHQEIKPWDILEPFKPQPKIFKPYELDDQMDINIPLDLSINRSHI